MIILKIISFQLYVNAKCVFSPQFAVFLWILTYVGAVFNGLTLVILCKIIVLSLLLCCFQCLPFSVVV